MKCFYHSADLDGHCSGAIVRWAYPDDCEVEMWPIDYGFPFPWDKIEPEETVYMVDFSLQPFELMVKLANMCNLVWIDHHKSAIEAHKEWNHHNLEHPLDILGVRKTGIGACRLTWDYLFNSFGFDAPVPMGVQLLAEYDVWNHSDPNCLPFQYGMRLKNTDPSSPEAMTGVWKRIFIDDVAFLNSTINAGITVLTYQKQLDAKTCKNAFEIEFEGLKFIAVNATGNSRTFESVWTPDKYDAMMTFHLTGQGHWTVNMYTDKPGIDLSVIAKRRGGGGHEKAAGFQTEVIDDVLSHHNLRSERTKGDRP